tara:strand:- start:3932 stop:4528 length:597 start_codon:yes stop_codon:yes gene_type:complete
MKTIKAKIKDIKTNPNNPRYIKDEKFNKLVQSIKELPEMLQLRPIVVNEEMVVLGGNMRLKACQKAGLKEVPIIKASDLTPEQQEEFIIKDNVGFGEWDWDMLANEWDEQKLIEWGMDLTFMNEKEEQIDEEIEFSEYLNEENNYVVIYFNNDIDWLQAETHFNLKSVYSKRSNGKPWSKGIGRIINGSDYLDRIKKS